MRKRYKKSSTKKKDSKSKETPINIMLMEVVTYMTYISKSILITSHNQVKISKLVD